MNSKLILAVLGATSSALKLQHLNDCECLDMTPNLRCDDQGENCVFAWADDECTIYENDAGYGLTCEAHDDGIAPFCDGEEPAEYCGLKWCYVSEACTATDKTLSNYPALAEAGIYFSYETCGEDPQMFGEGSGVGNLEVCEAEAAQAEADAAAAAAAEAAAAAAAAEAAAAAAA